MSIFTNCARRAGRQARPRGSVTRRNYCWCGKGSVFRCEEKLCRERRGFFLLSALLCRGVHDDSAEIKAEPERESDDDPKALVPHVRESGLCGGSSRLIPDGAENLEHSSTKIIDDRQFSVALSEREFRCWRYAGGAGCCSCNLHIIFEKSRAYRFEIEESASGHRTASGACVPPPVGDLESSCGGARGGDEGSA